LTGCSANQKTFATRVYLFISISTLCRKWPPSRINVDNFINFSRLKAFLVDLMASNDRIVIRDLGHLQTAIRNDDKAYCMSLQEKYGGFLPEDLAP